MSNLYENLKVFIKKKAKYFGFKTPIDTNGEFLGSNTYWLNRYKDGGNSGPGSYNRLAEFKAEILNSYVSDKKINSVIEFGCGDGNQLKYADYPSYLGFDISPDAIARCRQLFHTASNINFKLMPEYIGETAEMAISLDVIFHLIEDKVFESYMRTLFASAQKAVVIYSSNKNEPIDPIAPHVKHRHFTEWVETNIKDWQLVNHIPNKYPFQGDYTLGSPADFFIFERVR